MSTKKLKQALEDMDGDAITLNLNDIARDMSDFIDKYELSGKDIKDMDAYIKADSGLVNNNSLVECQGCGRLISIYERCRDCSTQDYE